MRETLSLSLVQFHLNTFLFARYSSRTSVSYEYLKFENGTVSRLHQHSNPIKLGSLYKINESTLYFRIFPNFLATEWNVMPWEARLVGKILLTEKEVHLTGESRRRRKLSYFREWNNLHFVCCYDDLQCDA